MSGYFNDPSVPVFDSGTHTSHFLFDANNYADTTAMKAAASSTQEQRGTLNLDTTAGPLGDKCLRVDWAAGGCGTDADVLLTFDGLGGGGEPPVIHIAWQLKCSTNYDVSCSSSDQKLVIVGQGTGNGRAVCGASWIGEQQEINCSGDEFCTRESWYVNTRESDPPPGYDFGCYKCPDPDSWWDVDNLFDGNWHDIVIRITAESVDDAGDGRVEHWVRPTGGEWRKTMNHLGDTPGNNAEGLVFTGPGPGLNIVQFPTTLNGGAPIGGMSIYYQNVQVYY